MSKQPDTVRLPGVAGQFYPADPEQLRQQLQQYLPQPDVKAALPKMIIAPHAGYRFSGRIAGQAYAVLPRLNGVVQRVVILAPAHRCLVQGVVAPSAVAFNTPIGDISIDTVARQQLVSQHAIAVVDQAFDGEHAIEVHLPFIQALLPQAKILPLLVGDASPEHVAQLMDMLWGQQETLFIISTDLSHFHPYNDAQALDQSTIESIRHVDSTSLTGENACGFKPLSAALLVAQRRQLTPHLIAYCNSGDCPDGDKGRVIGYGAFHIVEPNPAACNADERTQLLELVDAAIAYRFSHQHRMTVNPEEYSPLLQQPAATFVTLELDGQLRGCIGELFPQQSLVQSIVMNAYKAAFEDSRFNPLAALEQAQLTRKISILSPVERLLVDSEQALFDYLRVARCGLILVDNGHRSTFLPSVWAMISNPEDFIAQLKIKAGLAADYHSDSLAYYHYSALEIK